MRLGNVGFLASLVTASSPSVDLLSNLLGYWNFDQSSGSDEPDLAGSVGNLVHIDAGVGNVGSDVGPNGGKLSRTFAYDGNTNALAVNNSTAGTFPLTINFWVKIAAGSDGGGGCLPFNFNEVTTWGPPLSLYSYSANSYWTVNDDNGSSVVYYDDTTSYADDTWYMFTWVVKDDLTVEIWRNGILLSIPNAGWDNPPLTGTAVKAFDSISFGRSIYLGSPNPGDSFAGAMSMSGIWHRALTSTEITALYNSGNGRLYSEL